MWEESTCIEKSYSISILDMGWFRRTKPLILHSSIYFLQSTMGYLFSPESTNFLPQYMSLDDDAGRTLYGEQIAKRRHIDLVARFLLSSYARRVEG